MRGVLGIRGNFKGYVEEIAIDVSEQISADLKIDNMKKIIRSYIKVVIQDNYYEDVDYDDYEKELIISYIEKRTLEILPNIKNILINTKQT